MVKLARNVINGKILAVIKSMYSKLKACVKLNGNILDIFTCNVRLMQGNIYHPCFILYMLMT